MKLSPKQRSFADNFIKSGNKYRSAIEAGYSENYARSHAEKLSENVGIKSYIDERMKRIESDKIAKLMRCFNTSPQCFVERQKRRL